MKKIFDFNHESENLAAALSIPKETEKKVEEIIFYSAACNYLLGKELFENEDDRPKSLTTITGDLEKALGLTESQQEISYLLFRFNNIHDLAIECINKYKTIVEAESPFEQKKAIMFIELLNIKLEEALQEKKQELDNNFISPVSIINRIRLVKESRYDFDRYLNLINQNKSKLNTFNPELFYEQ